MLRPSISRGRPAFGCADELHRARPAPSARSSRASPPGRRCSSRRRRRAPSCSRPGTNVSGAAPSSVLPSSSVVTCATIGRSQTLRTARIAALISFRSRNVSRMKRSTPPSSSALRLFAEVAPPPRRRRSCPTARCGCRAGRSRRRRTPVRARRAGRSAPLQVDRVDPLGQPERAELDAVGAERVGLDDVRAGAHVGLVHLGDQVRLRQVQLVERPVEEDALRVQHRPHRAVADEHALVDRFEEGGPGHVRQLLRLNCWYFNVFRSISRYDVDTRSRQTDGTPCRSSRRTGDGGRTGAAAASSPRAPR